MVDRIKATDGTDDGTLTDEQLSTLCMRYYDLHQLARALGRRIEGQLTGDRREVVARRGETFIHVERAYSDSMPIKVTPVLPIASVDDDDPVDDGDVVGRALAGVAR